MDETARIGLAGITLDVAMISVWGIHNERIRDAVALAAQHNVILTEDELIELGSFWAAVWQLGEKSAQSKNCLLCGARLPNEFDLCACYDKKRVGKYIDFDVPGRIAEIAAKDPANWRSYTALSFVCETCGAVRDIQLSKIADRFNQGKPWLTPRFCTPCSNEHKAQKRANTAKQLPAPDTPAPEAQTGDTEQ